jgi:hypothetical protein
VVNVDRCPTCGWPAINGGPCPRCASPLPSHHGSVLVPSGPATSVASTASGTTIVVLLILLGLFWIVVAALQFRVGLAGRPGGTALLIAIIGFWNLIVGGYTLSVIREVVRRSYHAPGQLVLISIGSVGWGLFATLWLGGWFHLLVVPLSMGLFVLAWTNSSHFDARRGREKPPVRSLALACDRGIEAGSPVGLHAPPPPPPWEQPLLDTGGNDSLTTTSPSPEGAGWCIMCGDRAVADSAFCQACDAARMPSSTARARASRKRTGIRAGNPKN